MKSKDQQLLEEAYESIYYKQFLLERVYGNIAVVYHRKKGNPEESSLFTKGVGGANREGSASEEQTQGEIERAKYGTGLYACYDFNSQLKKEMAETYGEFIVKGKLDLTNFFFLDQEAFRVAQPRGNFLQHLESLRTEGNPDKPGFQFHQFHKFKQRVKENKLTKVDLKSQIDISLEIWPYLKRQGFAGLMYLNQYDGKVAVIYNRSSFLPFGYANVPVKEIKRLLALPEDQREKAVTWTSKMPDIRNIKRGYDQGYDLDLQKQSARDIIRLNSSKVTEVPFLNLDLMKDLTNANFPYIRNIKGELRLVEYRRDRKPIKLSMPNLETVLNLNISAIFEGSSVDLRSLKNVKKSCYITIEEPPLLDNLETVNGDLWINHPNANYNLKQEVSLPKLKTCGSLSIPKTLKIDLRSLQSCKRTINAPECMEIILPEKFKGKKTLGKGCKITLV
jgi:hypothetical protein